MSAVDELNVDLSNVDVYDVDVPNVSTIIVNYNIN